MPENSRLEMRLDVTVDHDHNASGASLGCAMQICDGMLHAETAVRSYRCIARQEAVRGRTACSIDQPYSDALSGSRCHLCDRDGLVAQMSRV